jgi:hypothetical protein
MQKKFAEAAETAPNSSSSLADLPAPLIERGRYHGEQVLRGSLLQVTAAAVAMLMTPRTRAPPLCAH